MYAGETLIFFMFKFLIPVLFTAIISIVACKNSDKENVANPAASSTLTDSLEKEVMDGHNVGMAKYGKLKGALNATQKLLDSIAKLPAKSRELISGSQKKLEKLAEELNSAISGMDKWMDEYNMDSAVNNAELRIKYLADEKIKVTTVKEAILNSLQKADTLLKANL
jgi:Na+/phosphate symporter